jgi:hypothetical protein
MSYGYVPPGLSPPRKSWLMRNKVMVAVAAVAVAIGAIVAVIVSRGSSGPTAYLAASASQVEFITWQQTGSGIQGHHRLRRAGRRN